MTGRLLWFAGRGKIMWSRVQPWRCELAVGPAAAALTAYGVAMELNELVQAIQTLNAEDAFRARLSLDQWRIIAPYLTQIGRAHV